VALGTTSSFIAVTSTGILRIKSKVEGDGPYKIDISFTDNKSAPVKARLDVVFKAEPCLIGVLEPSLISDFNFPTKK